MSTDADRVAALLVPGAEIEVQAGETFGIHVWDRYRVAASETPRQDGRGRWLFAAEYLETGNVCPMLVAPDRLRAAAGVTS